MATWPAVAMTPGFLLELLAEASGSTGRTTLTGVNVTAAPLEFVSVIVSTLVSFVPPLGGVNDFATLSGEKTVSDALAATVFAPALIEVTEPIARALAYVAPEALVTLTVTVQEPLAGIVPAESATLEPPFVAVTVPAPHVVAPAGVAVFTSPAG